jgi:hypothetical protein
MAVRCSHVQGLQLDPNQLFMHELKFISPIAVAHAELHPLSSAYCSTKDKQEHALLQLAGCSLQAGRAAKQESHTQPMQTVLLHTNPADALSHLSHFSWSLQSCVR